MNFCMEFVLDPACRPYHPVTLTCLTLTQFRFSTSRMIKFTFLKLFFEVTGPELTTLHDMHAFAQYSGRCTPLGKIFSFIYSLKTSDMEQHDVENSCNIH